jgi:hypothetical protein
MRPPKCPAVSGSRHSVRPRRAAQRPAQANPARSATDAVPRRGQHPPPKRPDAAIRVHSSGGPVTSRPPGGHAGPASRGSPLHGPDGIQDTQARHDAPSPRPARHRDRARLVIAARASHRPPVCCQRRRGEELPPGGTERAARAPIRQRRRTRQPHQAPGYPCAGDGGEHKHRLPTAQDGACTTKTQRVQIHQLSPVKRSHMHSIPRTGHSRHRRQRPAPGVALQAGHRRTEATRAP